MIAPLLNYSIRGVIWYQGEANANPSTAFTYRKIFPGLISDWRNKWGQGEFPFYFVQLAGFSTRLSQSWAVLRESQLKTLSVPNTGMVVAVDIGEAKDIHPKNKKDVGERLSLCALAKVYGKKLEYSGPLYEKMQRNGNKVTLCFSHNDGLHAKGGSLKGFELAGKDKKFYPADAVISADKVIVSSPEVKHPAIVRYAWKGYPQNCNLYNKANLPASPFRTGE
jgi:sialate O-acetylesterase